jgi:hypothetical protein
LNILLLGYDTLKSLLAGHRVFTLSQDGPINLKTMRGFDLIISYGYRHIIPAEILEWCPAINLHISYLPWGRGAHPLFWALYSGEPIGVSIHYVDEGIDTGPIIIQREVQIDERGTLTTEYQALQAAVQDLFRELVQGQIFQSTPQVGTGSYHKSADLIREALPQGWDTPVAYVREYGADSELSSQFWEQYQDEIGGKTKNG